MTISKVVKDEVDKLIKQDLIPPEHKTQARKSLERELRRRTNSIVSDVARKVGLMYLLRLIGAT